MKEKVENVSKNIMNKLNESFSQSLKESYSIEQILDSRSLWRQYYDILVKKINYEIAPLAKKHEIVVGWTMATLRYYPVYQRDFSPRCPYILYQVRINEEYKNVRNKTEYKSVPEDIKQDFLNKVNDLVNELRSKVDGIVVNENDSSPFIFVGDYIWIRIRLDIDKLNIK